MLAALSASVFFLVWIYGNALRDPRYLDGWILAAGMGLQLGFHIAIKSKSLSPKATARWRKVHIFIGYVLIAAFVTHSDFSLPDTVFEWLLWTGFVLVTATGIFGTYLAWSNEAKRGHDERFNADTIPARTAELARRARAIVVETSPSSASAIPLPAPAYDTWILDLYSTHLEDFFAGPRNIAAHLIGSANPVKRLTSEIDNIARYVDKPSQEKLDTIKELVIDKDRLDFARVHTALTRGWLLIHVPVTYALIVLTVLHVIIVYAFSAGAW